MIAQKLGVVRLIGEGRDRRVFAHSRRLVCKEARNDAGLLQNLREAIISKLAPPSVRTLARVTSVLDGGLCIHSERMSTAPEIVFEQRIGGDFVPRLLRSLRVAARQSRGSRGTLGPEIQETLNFLVRDMQIATPDLERLENWGLRRKGRLWEPVLLDYGLSVMSDFFRRHQDTLSALGDRQASGMK